MKKKDDIVEEKLWWLVKCCLQEPLKSSEDNTSIKRDGFITVMENIVVKNMNTILSEYDHDVLMCVKLLTQQSTTSLAWHKYVEGFEEIPQGKVAELHFVVLMSGLNKFKQNLTRNIQNENNDDVSSIREKLPLVLRICFD